MEAILGAALEFFLFPLLLSILDLELCGPFCGFCVFLAKRCPQNVSRGRVACREAWLNPIGLARFSKAAPCPCRSAAALGRLNATSALGMGRVPSCFVWLNAASSPTTQTRPGYRRDTGGSTLRVA